MEKVAPKEIRFTPNSSPEGGVLSVLLPLIVLPLGVDPTLLSKISILGVSLVAFALLFGVCLLVPRELRVRKGDQLFTRQWLLFPKRLAKFDELEALRARGKTLWAVRKDGNPLRLLDMKDPFLVRAAAELISSYTDIALETSAGSPSGALWYEQAPGAQGSEPSHLESQPPEGLTELRLGYGTFLKFDSGLSPGRRLSGFGLMLASFGGLVAMHLGTLHLLSAYITSTLKIPDLWTMAGLIAFTGIAFWTYFKRPHWRSIPVDLLITAEGIHYYSKGEVRQLLHSQVSRVEAVHRRRHGENLAGSLVEIRVPNVGRDWKDGTIIIDRLDRSTADYLASRMPELARRATRTVEAEQPLARHHTA